MDSILNNAAIDPRESFERSSVSLWSLVLQVNLLSAVSLTQSLLPALRRSPQGRVLFTGSVVCDLGAAYLGAYAASKGALLGLTRSLAHELKGTGITVNCIVPGAICVEKEGLNEQENRQVIGWQSIPRRLGPGDILGPVCLLLSEAGSGITGQAITIDGGLLHPLADVDTQGGLLPNQISKPCA